MKYDQIIIEENQHNQIINEYQKGKLLGTGGFAKVYQVVNVTTHKKYAAKIISKSEITDKKSKNKLLFEIKLHKSLNHKNIVKFERVFEDKDFVYILMQLCINQTLKGFTLSSEMQKRRSRLTQFEIKSLALQLISGVNYLHSNRIIHRDLKLGNIFINYKMEMKIGDFGLSTRLKHEKQRKYTVCGTPNYIAPQVLKQAGHSFQADLWSFGVIIYTIAFGKPPFESETVQQTYENIKKNRYLFPKYAIVSNELKDLLKGILVSDPYKRLNLQQILMHPFLSPTYRLPQFLPPYVLGIPPQANYIKQFIPQGVSVKITQMPKRLERNRMQRALSQRKFQNQQPKKEINKQKLDECLSQQNRKKYLVIDQIQTDEKNPKDNAFMDTNKVIRSMSPGQQIKNLNTLNSARSCGTLNPKPNEGQIIQIKYFSDCSQKYGLGYLLQNNLIGVLFNDKTSLLQVEGQFSYINNQRQVIKLQKIPQILQKKHQILKMFKKHFEQKNKKGDQIKDQNKEVIKIDKQYQGRQRFKSQLYEKYEDGKKGKTLIPRLQLGNIQSIKNNPPKANVVPIYIKRFFKKNNYIIFKFSNGCFYFMWGKDYIIFRGYKWIKYKLKGKTGEGIIGEKFNGEVEKKMQKVREFLKKHI